MRITIDDVRKAGICAIGARRWFDARGISFSDFIANGIDADELIARGDAYAVKVVEAKKAREQNG